MILAKTNQIKYYHCTQECTVSKNGKDIFFAKGYKNCEYSCSAFNKYFYLLIDLLEFASLRPLDFQPSLY